jgi:hypothetical protein
VETLKGMPADVGRFFDRVSRDVKTGMQKVGDQAQPASAPTAAGQPASGMGQAVEEGAAAAGQSIIGYDDSRRRLAKHHGVDPYTTNAVLAHKMDAAAWAVWGRGVWPRYGDRRRSRRVRRQAHAGLGERPRVGHDPR